MYKPMIDFTEEAKKLNARYLTYNDLFDKAKIIMIKFKKKEDMDEFNMQKTKIIYEKYMDKYLFLTKENPQSNIIEIWIARREEDDDRKNKKNKSTI
jgi:hypothetical protein